MNMNLWLKGHGMLKTVYAATPALWDRVKETCPLPPHVSDPIDIANGALFLASDEARCVTGSELVMDCGYMAHQIDSRLSRMKGKARFHYSDSPGIAAHAFRFDV